MPGERPEDVLGEFEKVMEKVRAREPGLDAGLEDPPLGDVPGRPPVWPGGQPGRFSKSSGWDGVSGTLLGSTAR